MDSLHNQAVRLEDLMPLIREHLAAGQSVRFSPRGTSMLPMLRQGIDSVVLSPLPEKLRKYDLPLYERSSGHYVLHRIVKAEDSYTCVGDNQFDLEPGLRSEQMIAVVTSFYRGDREWKMNDFRYRAYCCIWHHSRPLRKRWRTVRAWLGKLLRRQER